MDQPQVYYNAIMFEIRGYIVISSGTYTCNVTDGTYWYAPLVYLMMTDAEKIFPGCSAYPNGTTFVGWFNVSSTDHPHTFSFIKYSVNTIQMVSSVLRGTSNGEKITTDRSNVFPPVTLMKSETFTDL